MSIGDATTRPLRIAMVSSSLSGGFGKQVHLLATALGALGHQVTIFLPGDARWPRFTPDYRLFRIGRPLPFGKHNWLAADWPLAAALLRRDMNDFDVVHGHGTAVMGARAGALRVRTFYGAAIDEARHAHVTSVRRFAWLLYQLHNVALEQLTAPLTGFAVGISPATRERLRFVRRVIPCAVDLTRYTADPAAKSPHPTILSVGTTYWGRKRLWLLKEEFERVVKPMLPDAELWLVTRERTSAPGIHTFCDLSEEDLISVYQRAWVFCLPSTYEGFGVPYIEAMACGTPIVATPNAGANWILEDGRSGLLAPADSLGEELVALLTSPLRRAEYRSRGLQRVKRFGSETVAGEYVALYRELMEIDQSSGHGLTSKSGITVQ